MKITNIANGTRGFWHKGRIVSLAPGQSVDLDLSDEAAAGVRGNPESFTIGAKAAEKAAEDDRAPAYAVRDKGRGWFVVMNGDQEATKSLRADDVEGFDAMSDEDKAAFVDLHKAD